MVFEPFEAYIGRMFRMSRSDALKPFEADKMCKNIGRDYIICNRALCFCTPFALPLSRVRLERSNIEP